MLDRLRHKTVDYLMLAALNIDTGFALHIAHRWVRFEAETCRDACIDTLNDTMRAMHENVN